MIKKICILLLIFIAVVGLSSAASAASLTQSASQRFTTAKSIDKVPTVTGSFYYKIKTFTVTTISPYSLLAKLRNQYPSPLYKVSISRLLPTNTVRTTWLVTISKWRTV